MHKVEENRQNFAILAQSKFTNRTYPEPNFGTDLLAKIFPEQRQRLVTNFHRTKTELHRTGVDLASPGDGLKSAPAQNLAQGGRGGLPDGGSDPGPKTGRSRAVSGARRVPAGVVHPPLNPPENGQGGVDAPGSSGGGGNFFVP
ncbi:MAG: hypothetical protein WC742_15130 [Gallionellaceae bacterium]|jgi:hypothetical protein